MNNKTIEVNSIPDNRPTACRDDGKRTPLVHLIMSDDWRTQFFTFHPDDAPSVIKEIKAAANAAKRGRDREAKISLRSEPLI